MRIRSFSREAVAPPDYAMYTANVAVDDRNEIAQNSSCMLVHSQGTFCSVVHFRINTTAPAVGLRRVPQKTTKHYVTYHMVPHACCCTNPKKQNKIEYHNSYSYVLVQQ